MGVRGNHKGKNMQKWRSKQDRCYNCGGLDHLANKCKCHPSLRSATSGRASAIWWPHIHFRSSRPPVHRESQPTFGGKKRSIVLSRMGEGNSLFAIRQFQGVGINRQNGESGDMAGRGQLALPCTSGRDSQPHSLFPFGTGLYQSACENFGRNPFLHALSVSPPPQSPGSKVSWTGKLFSF